MEFIGDNLSKKVHMVHAMLIDPSNREGEADLVHTRWFDYADMHPVRATYLYAHFYKQQTRIFCETCIDIETASEARAFTPNDIFKSRDITAMWLARRACDAIGCPYDFALLFAQARALERLYKTFPRPNQLYGEEFEIDLLEAWKNSVATVLRYSRDEKFKAKNNKGSWVQKRHTAALLDQVKKRLPASQINLLGRLIHEGVLDSKMLEQHFPLETIDQAHVVAKILE